MEDESIVALDLQHRLTSLGFDVTGHAVTGLDAVRLAGETAPDVVLMDIQLRGDMDGIEAAARIMEDLRIPVVFLTAFSDVESLERAKQAEAYGYLLKPFQEREVRIAIEMAVYKHGAEAELRSSRSLLTTTINGIEEGVVTADTDGSIMLLNAAATRLTGWDKERAIGRTIDEVLEIEEPEDRDRAGWTLLRRRDGTTAEVSVESNHLEDGRRVVVIRDVSAEREQQRRLIAARDAAEAAIAARTDFLSRVTHELRTPLNSIQGMSQLLRSDVTSREGSEYLEIIEASAAQLSAMVSDILDYSHIQAGTLELHPDHFDPVALVEETVRALALGRSAEQLRIGISVSPAVPRDMVSDPQRLSQIIRHLAGNAIKFTPAGHVFVAVRWTDGTGLSISVEDTGPGLDQESLQHLLEDFTQAERPATRRAGGLGLGLALVRRLVKTMDGTLDYTARDEGGAIFTVTIPDKKKTTDDHRARRSLEDLVSRVPVVWTDDRFVHRIWEPWCSEAGIPIRMITERTEMSPGADDLAVLRDASHPTAAVARCIRIASARDLMSRNAAPPMVETFLEPVTLDEILQSLEWHSRERSDAEPPEVEDVDDPSPVGGRVGPSILIVDDDLHNRIVIERLIATLGSATSAVRNGVEAMESLQNHAFDMALVDIEMPEMDGWELCRLVRDGGAGESCSGVPLVAVSAHDRDTILERALSTGFDEVLSKPLVAGDLKRVIAELYEKRTMLADRRQWMLVRRLLDAGDAVKALSRLKDLRNSTQRHDLAEISFRLMLAIRREDHAAIGELIDEVEEELAS